MVERERETIIATDSGRRGGGSALALTAVALVLLVLVFLLFGRGLMSNGSSPTKTFKADINVNLPSTGGNGGTTGSGS